MCASVGGKFHRPYFRAVSQVTSPVLRLYFFSESAVGDVTARFVVRYAAGTLDPRTRPANVVATSLALLASHDDLRPLVAARPAGKLVERIAPGYPGRMPPTFPPDWLP